MRDTLPEVAAKYREMLLARPAEERLKMGASMYGTVRAFVIASIREAEPSASPGALRRALFLRFYGHEFNAQARERIASWLGRDEPRPGAPTRPRRAP